VFSGTKIVTDERVSVKKCATTVPPSTEDRDTYFRRQNRVWTLDHCVSVDVYINAAVVSCVEVKIREGKGRGVTDTSPHNIFIS
jgi:hypothetical protein